MADTSTTPQAPAPPAPAPVPASSSKELVWHGANGQRISYRATAELLPIHHYETGALIGTMFMISYLAQDGTDDRPVTFLWNGGPGASSDMINIGGLGPHYVPVRGTGHLSNPSVYRDNPYTLLQESDLVFIDAFGCGLSKVDPSFDAKAVWGVDGDASACASGVAAWIQKHRRYNSPLFLYGESYGTLRNALVFRLLGERGVSVTGVIEQSSILDFAPTLSGNDDYYLGMLPLYASAACHFGKAGAQSTVSEWWDKAQSFADTALATAITQGDNLSTEAFNDVAQKMSQLIGLSPDFIKSRGLRIELDDFRAHLLESEGKFIGRYDMRYTSFAYKPVQGDSEFFSGEDPSMDAISSPYVSAYLRLVQETGFEVDPNYNALNFQVNQAWNWAHQAPGTQGMPAMPDGSFDISCALRRNPRAHILFIGGYFDAATPFWNVRHDMAKLFLPPELKTQIQYRLYETGHMTYADDKVPALLAADLKAFYGKCTRALDD